MGRRSSRRPAPSPGPQACLTPGAGPPRPEVQTCPRWLSPAICLALALAVWAVFGQTRDHGFVNYDDDVYVYNHSVVSHGLSRSGVVWAFTHTHGGNWHPLTTVSHMLDCQLWGLHPGGPHLTNVLFHAATAILLFLTLRTMTGALWRSAFVAAAFALHPLHVESVAWVSERKDVLSGLFCMLSLWAWKSYARATATTQAIAPTAAGASAPAPGRWTADYYLALVFFALGLMSKPMLVTLPFVLLLLDFWPLRRVSEARPRAWIRGHLLTEKIPFLLLTAAACVATIVAQKGALASSAPIALPWRIANALVAYVDYLRQTLVPTGLAVFYPHPGDQLPGWRIALSGLLLILISAGVVAGRRKQPGLLVGWLWFVGMLVPVIGLMQVGGQARADRYTYLPQIGLGLLVAWGTAGWCPAWRYRRAALASGSAVLLAGLAATAYIQTTYWKSSVSLWRHTLACTRGNALAHNNLGLALFQNGKLDEAIEQFRRALELKPGSFQAQDHLGLALCNRGRFAEAVEHCERAVALEPRDALAHVHLADALAGQGKMAPAIQQYEQALQLNPEDAETHINLGNALTSQGDPGAAVEHYQRAIQLEPKLAEAHSNLGNALFALGRLDEARQCFQRAIELKPGSAEAHQNLGSVLARQEKLAAAIPEFERAIALQPGFTQAHLNLANALAALGKPMAALPHYQRALKLAQAQKNVGLVEALRAHLERYQPGAIAPQGR